MGRMKELYLQRLDARPVAFKLLLDTRYDLHEAYRLGWQRVREGLLMMDGNVLCEVLKELHAEGEPLKGVTVIMPDDSQDEEASPNLPASRRA